MFVTYHFLSSLVPFNFFFFWLVDVKIHASEHSERKPKRRKKKANLTSEINLTFGGVRIRTNKKKIERTKIKQKKSACKRSIKAQDEISKREEKKFFFLLSGFLSLLTPLNTQLNQLLENVLLEKCPRARPFT